MITELTGIIQTDGSPDDPLLDSALQTGVIRCGHASAPTGVAFWQNNGTSYGDGCRYEHEEIPALTKVTSKHRRFT